MLGKIIKYEFKNKYKLMLSIYGAFIIMTVLGCLAANYMYQENNPGFISILTFIFYILSISALFLTTIIYLGMDYHKTLFSSQAYLTYTLPAKRSTILNGKIIGGTVWLCATVILLVLSVFTLISVFTGNDYPTWAELEEGFRRGTNMSLGLFLFLYIVSGILSIIQILLWFLASMYIGQLSNKNKNGMSILAGIGFYVLGQITGGITFLGIIRKFAQLENANTIPVGYFTRIMLSAIIFVLVSNIILYCVSYYINEKKLNIQ